MLSVDDFFLTEGLFVSQDQRWIALNHHAEPPCIDIRLVKAVAFIVFTDDPHACIRIMAMPASSRLLILFIPVGFI